MYQGSNFKKVNQNIVLGCISPEANNLLETIMEHWEDYLAKLKKSFPLKEPSFYSFAYWLVRYSGLIQPTIASQPGAESGRAKLSKFCQDCKDEFGHPDNCIGCDHAPAI